MLDYTDCCKVIHHLCCKCVHRDTCSLKTVRECGSVDELLELTSTQPMDTGKIVGYTVACSKYSDSTED